MTDGYFGFGEPPEHTATGNELAIRERSENQTAKEKRIAARAYLNGQNKVYHDLINWDRNRHDHHDHCVLCQALYALGPHPSCICHTCILDHQMKETGDK